MHPEKLPKSFYLRDDVTAVGRDLLGKILRTDIDGQHTAIVITETEAYAGVTDKASHAYGDRRTRRTEHAVLVRAGEPVSGLPAMLERRGKSHPGRSLLAGPGSVARALGITTALTGSSLLDGPISIFDLGLNIDEASIGTGPRIGVDYAGEDAARPYRFRLDPHAVRSLAASAW
jgi:DNA-3-methyladenine glycosylase